MSQARGSLLKQKAIEHPLLFGEFGGRVRKDIGYVRHYMPEFRATLESADLVMVTDQNGDVQFYMVDPRTKPIHMPERKIAVSTKWGTPIPVVTGNIAPTQSSFDLTNMDMAYGEIGMWKVYAKTGGFEFTIDQPNSNNPVFTDGTHTIWMDYGNTGANVKKANWGAVPELVTFEKETPVFLNVRSNNMNTGSENHMGYVAYQGYRYKMIKTSVPNPSDEPRVVVTIQLGSLK